jgi:hypothetical protein
MPESRFRFPEIEPRRLRRAMSAFPESLDRFERRARALESLGFRRHTQFDPETGEPFIGFHPPV